jgi:uncharacterized protein
VALVIRGKLSRVGWQEYPSGPEYRDPSEVFAPKALESFAGVPLTTSHRMMTVDDVHYAVGYVRKVWKDDTGHFMIGEVVVTDPSVIERVKTGDLLEFSCGYETQVVDKRQTQIRGNHVTILEPGRSRCGASCSIL